MKRGVISIGTNSTRALVATLGEQSEILLTRSTGTRIGEGLKERGRLEGEPMRRTLDAIREHTQAVRELTGEIRSIATSALRRADNCSEFSQRVREITGVPLEVISGDEEARRSFHGAVSAIDEPEHTTFGVVDVGGGSAEYAVGRKESDPKLLSCEIGAVRLTETVPELAGTRGAVDERCIERARSAVRAATDKLETFERVDRLMFVGGSATTAISILRGNRDRFDYAPLGRGELQGLIEQLRALDLEERKIIPGMNPQRADILLAGLLIIDMAFERAHHNQALVSTNDLLLGTLLLSEHSAGS